VDRAGEFLPKTRFGWWLVIVLAVLVGVAVVVVWKTDQTNRMWLGRHICRSNLDKLASACQAYATDNGGNFPDRIERLSPKYVDKPATLKCPSDKSGAATSYAIVPGLSTKAKPVRILVYDRHGGHTYVARTDGGVDGIRGRTAEDVEAEIKAEAARERGN
jgi:hypothetical protein